MYNRRITDIEINTKNAMKKIVLTLILAWLTWTGTAQGFVRIDTVYTPYFDFDYESWLADSTHPLLTVQGSLVLPPLLGHTTPLAVYGDRMEYNYIEDGADVYGIAVWAIPYPLGPAYDPIVGVDWDTTRFAPLIPDEYLYLYEAELDTLIELAKVRLDIQDSASIKGKEWFPGQWANPSLYCNDHHYRRGEHFYRWDVMFDKPIHVVDSFYVGHSCYGWHAVPVVLDEPPPLYCYMYWFIYSTDGESRQYYMYDSTCYMPTRNCKIRLRHCPYGDTYDSIAGSRVGLRMEEWGNYPTHEFFGVAPILRTFDTIWTVDTPACTPVHDLGILSRFGDTITLRWSHDGSHDEWQLSYGPQGMHPDNGTFVTCHNNRWRFKDTLNVPMVAYVRTVCRELDTLRYSDWCEPVEWLVQGNGIDPANPLAEFITVMPNPATDMVSVSSEFPLYGIEVYSSTGTKLLNLDAEGLSASFSVQDWSKGVYLVVVRTSRGILSKKLVVE